MGRRRWWDELAQDLAFATRQLRRTPSFAVVAVSTLALAIGANTAVFSVTNAVVLEPPPYGDPDGLATLSTRYLPISGFEIDKFPLSGPELLDVREQAGTFTAVGGFVETSRALTGDGLEAERIPVALVTADVLPLLEVAPLLGRVFTEEEDVPGGPAVTVLGHDVWTTRFGADPAIVGRTIEMNGVPTEVVGVMPEGFAFPERARAWLPAGLDRTSEGGRGGHGWSGVARLRQGRTLEDAHAELSVVAERWALEYEHNVGHYVWTQSLRDEILGDAPRTTFLLMSAVGLVLLVACANVTNLLLARGERRQAEVAVRAAMGAGRARIVRQLVTESLVLAAVAAAFGIVLAAVGTRALVRIDPGALPRLDEVGLSPEVLLFTVGVAVLAALLSGVVPALLSGERATRRLASATSRAPGGRGRSSLRRGLVAVEVAVCLVVVILAGLITRSFAALSGTDPGLEAGNLLTFGVTLPSSGYPDAETLPVELSSFMDGLASVPGVTNVAATTALPFSGSMSRWDFQLDDRPPRQEGDMAWNAGVAIVSAGYFETLGIPMLAGRGFTRSDGPDDAWVGVVSETMAATYWPGEDPLGKRWGYAQTADSTTWITVVGVARDPIVARPGEEIIPYVWLPLRQAGRSGYVWPRSVTVAVRTGLPLEAVTPDVRASVRAFDPDLPLYGLRTMEDAIDSSLAQPRLATNLLGLFALLALGLAAVGIYGVVSYSVAGRTGEIGVRLALGAGRGAVQRMVLWEGVRPAALGIAVGLLGAWYATRLVASMLYGVEPTDPRTFAALPLGLLGVAVAACWLPARRATRIAPTEALRSE